MTYRIEDEDTLEPLEPIDWDYLMPPRSAITGFLMAVVISFAVVTMWALAIIGLLSLI